MQNFKYQINGNGIQLKSGSSDQSDVPPQISVKSQEVAQTVTKTSQVITIMTAPGIVVANFLLSAALNLIWGLMNDLSFLMILTMISINVPGIVQQIQVAILNFIYMDIFMTDQWLPQLLFSQDELDNDKGLNYYFDINSYSSRKIMRNLGSAIIFIVLMVLGNILFLILKAIEKFTKRFERIKEKLGSSLYWGSTTRFILQQFTPIVLSSTITLLDFNTEHFFDSFGIFLAIALLFITALIQFMLN